LKDKGVDTLSKSLRYNFNLKVLDLNQVGMTDLGMSFLLQGLQYNFYLEVLNLRNNSIRDEGAFLIGELIKNNNQLKDLDVSCEILIFLKFLDNLYTDYGANEICTCLAFNQSLVSLKIDRQYIFTHVIYELLQKNRNEIVHWFKSIRSIQSKDIRIFFE
jgi:hypothetical protein